ncbi:ImmA/IrrE family metallo-endopeptidase [Paludibaculum fermentans]|uniref:IrrE N-terminal-like domain-containing protein n=1 Tax=Paludibaculum fermentans TaxID=1473598 RepID=A0A7S7SKM2_PALFE|nr:hypothetical protein [Paludibaculum fermentans]QOY87878.1 hypothetical protein IRI77_34945 [Paludibaculum fermentans]
MTAEFQIDVSWLAEAYGPIEIGKTAASLSIRIGEETATRIEDDWAKTVQSQTRVAAYPLAIWLASSWWRLRWEARPFKGVPGTSWRMAHELPAAGHGFLWPPLTFESDGERILASCRPTRPLSGEPLRYLADFRESISASSFERTIDDFLDLVLARLASSGVMGTELEAIWKEVREERQDPELARLRQLEACLGFEPDGAPEDVLSRLTLLDSAAGPGAINEIAPICSGPDPAQALAEIEAFASLPGVHAKVQIAANPSWEGAEVAPWVMGRELARHVRRESGLGTGAMSDGALADLIGMSSEVFGQVPEYRSPLGLAVRADQDTGLKLLFRKRNRPGRRFEAARFLGEQIRSNAEEIWLPSTDTSTVRQKVQRAFAAELLCPIDALSEFLRDDYSPAAFEAASETFGVSERAVESHLANNHLIPSDWVSAG